MEKIYDVFGIGFGPSNISLAILLEERGDMSFYFTEAASDSTWQKEMMLDKSDIQNNPHRDLITLYDPRNKYTFLNYLHENNKIECYLNLGTKFPFRKEYSKYINWVSEHFNDNVDYNTSITSVDLDESSNIYIIKSNLGKIYKARSLVLGTGRSAFIPGVFKEVSQDKCFHLTKYLSQINKIPKYKNNKKMSFTVVGASQSAVEIILDLSNRFPNAQIHNLIRSFSIKLKDTSPFSYEIFKSENTDFFYDLDVLSKENIRAELRRTNYSSVDEDVLKELYLKIYEQKLDNNQKIFIHNNSQILAAKEIDSTVSINVKNKYSNNEKKIDSDFVVLATGFRDIGGNANQDPYPKVLENIIDHFQFNERGYAHINRDYSLAPKIKGKCLPPLFLSGVCETSHGLGDSGSFSLIPKRCERILNSLEEIIIRKYKRKQRLAV